MAWNPDEPMMIATAADDDYNPIVLVWDLRNASQPTGQFQGHSASVTSIAWCQKDSDLLMSCGKDKRTVTLETMSYILKNVSIKFTYLTYFNSKYKISHLKLLDYLEY